MSTFASVVTEADALSLETEVLELLETQFQGWEPAEGNLEVWLVKAFARCMSIVAEEVSEISVMAFKEFGEKIIGVSPVLASSATVGTTWKMVDTNGYTITAGTKLNIASSGESLIAFEVVEDVVVPSGSDETEEGAVILRAVVPGTDANGLSADPEVSDSTAATTAAESITTAGVSSGGVEEEEESAYLNRLVETLRLLSISLILPEDFEVDARSYAGISRAKCIRGYDAEKEEGEVALCQTVFPIGPEGKAVSEAVKKKLLEGQEAKLISGVLHFVADPDYTKIDVTASVVVEAGFDPEAIAAAVKARLEEYFAPSAWGLPKNGEGSGWVNRTSVYFNDVISEIDRVGGVDRVKSLEIGKHGGSLGTKDIELTGVAPLAEPGTLAIEGS